MTAVQQSWFVIITWKLKLNINGTKKRYKTINKVEEFSKTNLTAMRFSIIAKENECENKLMIKMSTTPT